MAETRTIFVNGTILRLTPEQQERREAFLQRHAANYGGARQVLSAQAAPTGEILLSAEVAQRRQQGQRGLR